VAHALPTYTFFTFDVPIKVLTNLMQQPIGFGGTQKKIKADFLHGNPGNIYVSQNVVVDLDLENLKCSMMHLLQS
jgi:hypothetical protein